MNKKTVAMSLGAIAVIFFLAVAFDILADNVGTFVGVVFSVFSGLAWAFWPAPKKDS